MKTETLSPARAESAQAQARSHATRKPNEAPADLFAQLLAASSEVQDVSEPAALETPSDPPLSDDPKVLAQEDPLDGLPAKPDESLLTPFAAVIALPANGLPATSSALKSEAASTSVIDPALTEATGKQRPKDAPSTLGVNSADSRPEDLRLEPGAWVSTVAKGRAKTAPPPQQLAQAMEAGGLTARPGVDGGPQAWHMAAAGQPGQLLSQNLTPVQESALSTATLAESATAAGEQRGEQRGGQQQPSSGEPGRVILEAPGAVKTANAEASAAPTFAESLGEAMGESFESLGAQVSFWAASNTRRASMRLEAGLKEALEVEVTLDDGKAHLAFRTDDPQAREALRANAQQVLSELLAKSGLSLQGMSVDARDAQQSSGGQDGRSDGRRQGLRLALDHVGAAPADATRLQVKTTRPGLSVYA